MNKLWILLIFSALFACKNSTEKTEEVPEEDLLQELATLMQGSFHSERQSRIDSTYYNISLHMYPIWEDRGHYLYVEQALFEMQDRPYRQRVYQLSQVNDSIFSSAVYEIPNDSLWIGAWKTPEKFASLQQDSLRPREGCAVFLKRLGPNHYQGATHEQDCKSSLRGASYATSKVDVTPLRIESWDQGFNDSDEQVWGADKGGYIFDRIQTQQ